MSSTSKEIRSVALPEMGESLVIAKRAETILIRVERDESVI